MATSSIVDSSGNINTGVLQQELQEALQSDVRYKQIDNMKKKAVRVATDYDEFKAMVSCAHLKKLSSKEVESLSAAKKGWKKAHVKDTSSNMQLLSKEIEQEEQEQLGDLKTTKLVNKGKGPKLPKTCMELDRDLRRLKSPEEKLRLLKTIGSKKTGAMLNQGGDTDLLELVLMLVLQDGGESSADNTEGIDLVEWLKLLTESSQFGMMIQLAAIELLIKVETKLNSSDSADAEALKELYQRKRKS